MNRTLSSRFNDIDFSTPENEIQIENLRFSTFEEEYVDDEINKITNFLHFQIKFQECISLISYLKGAIEIFLFDNDKIIVYSDKERSEVLYENVYNFIKYKDMIVIMYDSIHGQIIPNRVFNNNRDEFYDYVSERIKYAREKQKEKNS